jgi:tetratricopeptide (TPR) repeat protein
MTGFRGQPPSGKKFCVACRELIPVEATICSHCRASQEPERPSWSSAGLKWVAGITAIVGLITGLSGVVGPLKGWWTQGRQSKSMFATALRQEELGEYPAAFDTLTEILKNKPGDIPALHARLDVTMLWIEDTWAPLHDNEEYAKQEQPIFARMTPVLEAGLGTSKDYRAADVVAHLGWLNLLKWKIVGEDGRIEEHLRRALQMDPSNVYANAMLGDFMLQTGGSVAEARAHFDAALKTGKVKDFVRGCQLESMIYNNSPGVRGELIRVANQMRKDNDAISDPNKSRIHSYYSPTIGTDAELREVVSAVPPDEAWATYQWVSSPESDSEHNAQEQRFIQANIDEVSGKKAEALKIYRDLAQETAKSDGRLPQRVRDAVRRLGP